MSTGKIASFVVLLLLGIIVWGWVSHFDYVVKTEDAGFDLPALKNQFLAASEFLQSAGIDVEVLGLIDDVSALSDKAVVLLAEEDVRLSETETEKLLAWISSGGHLIIGANRRHGHLAEKLGYSKEWFTRKADDQDHKGSQSQQYHQETTDDEKASSVPLSERLRRENEAYKKQWQEEKDLQAQRSLDNTWREYVNPWIDDYTKVETMDLSAYQFPSADQASLVAFGSDYGLMTDEPSQGFSITLIDSVKTPAGQVTHLTYQVDKGQVDVVLHTGIWENHHIGFLDHANVLKQLIARGEREQKVSIVTAFRVPSLYEYLRLWAMELMLSALVLLVCWLISRGCRVGPIQEERFEIRRSLMAHVKASGVFVWRWGGSGRLLHSLRCSVKSRVAVLLGGSFFPSEPAQWRQFLALLKSLDPALCNDRSIGLIYRALSAEDHQWMSQQDFVDTVRILQQLRKML